jgi:hypothetical protein
MSNCDKVYYGLQDSDGNLIGIDQASGGEPYAFDDSIMGVWLRSSREEIEKYNKVFKFGKRFTLVQVTLNVTSVK